MNSRITKTKVTITKSKINHHHCHHHHHHHHYQPSPSSSPVPSPSSSSPIAISRHNAACTMASGTWQFIDINETLDHCPQGRVWSYVIGRWDWGEVLTYHLERSMEEGPTKVYWQCLFWTWSSTDELWSNQPMSSIPEADNQLIDHFMCQAGTVVGWNTQCDVMSSPEPAD